MVDSLDAVAVSPVAQNDQGVSSDPQSLKPAVNSFRSSLKVTTIFQGPMTYIIGTGDKVVGSMTIEIVQPDNSVVAKMFDADGNPLLDGNDRPLMVGMAFDPVNYTFSTVSDYGAWMNDKFAVDGNLNDDDNRRTTGIFWDYRNKDRMIDGAWDISLPEID